MVREPDSGSGGGGRGGTSSADPGKLVDAANVVPDELRQRLAWIQFSLRWDIVSFHDTTQTPQLVDVDVDELASLAYHSVRLGNDIDTHLNRVAAAFYAVGEMSPFVGPLEPGATSLDMWTIGDAALAAQLAAWDFPSSPTTAPPPFEFGRCGEMPSDPRDAARAFAADTSNDPQPEQHCGQVRGPDGEWYTIVTRPPPGTPLVANSVPQVVDFGNPDYALVASARAIGLGQFSDGSLNHAPPGVYPHIGWDDDGDLIVGPDAGSYLPPELRSPTITDDPPPMPGAPAPPGGSAPGGPPRPAGPAAAGGAEILEGVFAGLAQSADERWAGVYQTQPSFYIDPATGERVAVVDAAQAAYDGNGDLVVVPGRVAFDDPERPTFVPLDVLYPPSSQPAMSAPRTVTIPAGGGD